ncbi:MAG: protein kinase domain-containing protein [Myxococcota bacterium]
MCPDENTLIRFAHGEAGQLPALEAHLDACESCRRAVAAAASTQTLPSAPVSRDLAPGQRVGRYEIERELGRGGMGVVYQARDVTLDRRVALKLLHARRDDAAQARLLREAQVMAKLAHPHVVPVFELGEWQQEVYLVMELVTGVTLEAWLKREKHATREILDTFAAAGRGLAAAHAAGVVHRDFKPANVLVGLDGRVRVTDFGLSRPGPTLELPATDSAVLTRDGAIVGTLAYMAPEQLDGKVADERSDQFSFCVSLVEALQGTRPFEGETWTQLSKSLTKAPRLAGVPRSLRGVLARGLAKEPSSRFASMTALLSALERARTRQWPGWLGVGVTAAAAAAVLVLLPGRPAALSAGATGLADDSVPVVMAAQDLPEGTVVTMEMLMQKNVPAQYVTSSSVKPDSVSYILGQKLIVAVQRGDPLLWTQFEVEKSVRVLVAKRDLTTGTRVTRELFEEKDLPEKYVTRSVVRADQASYIVDQKLNVDTYAGDPMLWTHFEQSKQLTPGTGAEWDKAGLTMAEVMEVMKDHRPAWRECMNQAVVEKVVVRWTVETDGTPTAVKIEPFEAGSKAAECFATQLGLLRFPAREARTEHIAFPFVKSRAKAE